MKLMVYLPMVMVIASNVIYHNVSKNTPPDANPMLSLAGTYLVSFICCMIIYLAFMPHDFQTDFRHLNWSTWALGLAIIGLEAGYLLIYRSGWGCQPGLAHRKYLRGGGFGGDGRAFL